MLKCAFFIFAETEDFPPSIKDKVYNIFFFAEFLINKQPMKR